MELRGQTRPPHLPDFTYGHEARLASNRGSEAGGHTHSTRTHQQVLVMGAILGLKVRHGVKGRGKAGDKQAGDNKEAVGRGGEREEGTRETGI